MRLLLLFFILANSFASAADPETEREALRADNKRNGASATKSGARYEGGDGSSLVKAVVIKGAKDSGAGVQSEYEWLRKKFPAYKLRQQSLRGDNGKKYDVLAITTREGKELEVFFDITDFFGKF
jgi:hypothetical protein